MEIAAFQGEVDRLTGSWTHTDVASVMLLMTEEMGELVRAIRKSDGKRWGHADEKAGSLEDVTEEIGDVMFLLTREALACGVDLNESALTVLAKIEARVKDP